MRRHKQPSDRHCFTCHAQLSWLRGSEGPVSSCPDKGDKGNVREFGRGIRKSAGSRCCIKARNTALIQRTRLTTAKVGAKTAHRVAAKNPSNAQVCTKAGKILRQRAHNAVRSAAAVNSKPHLGPFCWRSLAAGKEQKLREPAWTLFENACLPSHQII